MEQEQERGITITSAATTAPGGTFASHHRYSGHVDFTAEVERSLRVSTALWQYLMRCTGCSRSRKKFGVRLISTASREFASLTRSTNGADFEHAVDTIRKRLSAKPVAIQIPIGQEDNSRASLISSHEGNRVGGRHDGAE